MDGRIVLGCVVDDFCVEKPSVGVTVVCSAWPSGIEVVEETSLAVEVFSTVESIFTALLVLLGSEEIAGVAEEVIVVGVCSVVGCSNVVVVVGDSQVSVGGGNVTGVAAL